MDAETIRNEIAAVIEIEDDLRVMRADLAALCRISPAEITAMAAEYEATACRRFALDDSLTTCVRLPDGFLFEGLPLYVARLAAYKRRAVLTAAATLARSSRIAARLYAAVVFIAIVSLAFSALRLTSLDFLHSTSAAMLHLAAIPVVCFVVSVIPTMDTVAAANFLLAAAVYPFDTNELRVHHKQCERANARQG